MTTLGTSDGSFSIATTPLGYFDLATYPAVPVVGVQIPAGGLVGGYLQAWNGVPGVGFLVSTTPLSGQAQVVNLGQGAVWTHLAWSRLRSTFASFVGTIPGAELSCSLITLADGYPTQWRAAGLWTAGASLWTDIAVMSANTGGTFPRIKAIRFSGTRTTRTATRVQLVRRAANTGGTSTTLANVCTSDVAAPPATAVTCKIQITPPAALGALNVVVAEQTIDWATTAPATPWIFAFDQDDGAVQMANSTDVYALFLPAGLAVTGGLCSMAFVFEDDYLSRRAMGSELPW